MTGRTSRPAIICRDIPGHGRFRIFECTDAKLRVYDPERPWDDRCVATFDGGELGMKAALLFTQRGSAGAVT